MNNEGIDLIHLNFDRAKAAIYSIVPDPWFVTELMPILSLSGGAVPRSPELVVHVSREFDSAQFLVAIQGQELLTAGVAWGTRDRCGLYAFLLGYYEKSRGLPFPSHHPMPSSLPWLGTVGSPIYRRLPRRLQAPLLAWSRHLALAIMCHARAQN
jgi:hypothetical protein